MIQIGLAGCYNVEATEVKTMASHALFMVINLPEIAVTMTIEQLQPATDLELARAAAAGNTEAFEQLYKQHSRRVYSLCLRMLENAAQAEDMTQEVFLQVFRKLGSFRGDSAFTTWLHRLTVNQVLMHFRKRGVKLEKTGDENAFEAVVETPLQSTRRVSLVDRISLEKAISELPPGYRTVFVLHDVEGYEHEEIANMLGVSAGTSKSQLHKARMRLRSLLSKTNPTGVASAEISTSAG
jgi:RNA polymerase sigma-70 factor, ECF subfamily